MPLNDFNDLIESTSLKRPISKIAYLMAKISLNFNIAVNEFIELYKFHMATLAKKQNPNYSIVEISARTGLDRRFVSKNFHDHELKRSNSRIALILDKIRQVCINNQAQHIAKYGRYNSFNSICQQLSSGALTNKAIVSELLRRGEIVDEGRKYRVVNIEIEPEKTTIAFIKEISLILPEIQRICIEKNTKYIAKFGEINSFASACKINQSSRLFKPEDVAKYLIQRGFISDVGDRYQIKEWRYMIDNSNPNEKIQLLSKQLNRLLDTILSADNSEENMPSAYNMMIYSTQTKPINYNLVKTKIRKILKKAYKQTQDLLEEYEEDVPFRSYPPFGATLFIFDESNMMDEERS